MKAKILHIGSYHLPKENQVTQESMCVNSAKEMSHAVSAKLHKICTVLVNVRYMIDILQTQFP